MEVARSVLVAVSMAVVVLLPECSLLVQSQVTYSSRLIHRFSDETRAFRASKMRQVADDWPEDGSLGYYRRLMNNDAERQKMNVGSHHQLLFPSAGSKTMSGGNDLGWCSLVFGASIMQDNDLNEYNPSHSSTSKSITCSHELCEMGQTCKSPKQPCPYTVNYASADTSSSGSLVEDILHLASDGVNGSNTYVRAPIIVGCGKKQSGGYLDGIAPDGLLGLGLGDVSVPSLLARSGVTRNIFSLCFGESGSGYIYFGDQGLSTQRTTPFLPIDGKYIAYIIGVENFCIGTNCLDETSFKAQFDSGTSFTLLPDGIYKAVVEEFDRQANAMKMTFEGMPFEHCYRSSSQELSEIPSVAIKFSVNNTFLVREPLFVVNDNQGGIVGFCLAVHSSPDEMGLIGQNFMKGYRLVFDRENLTLGWSHSRCQPLKGEETLGSNASSPSSLPRTEQQRAPPHSHAVAPAFASRTPSKSSAAFMSNSCCLLLFLLFHQLWCKHHSF